MTVEVTPEAIQEFTRLIEQYNEALSRYRFAHISQVNSEAAVVISGNQLERAIGDLRDWMNSQVGNNVV